jgi:hypothetical protein
MASAEGLFPEAGYPVDLGPSREDFGGFSHPNKGHPNLQAGPGGDPTRGKFQLLRVT